jgi:hypothetical protein
MARYVRNPELARRHGAWNAAHRDRHDEAHTIDQLEHLYAHCLREPPPQRTAPVVVCGGAAAPEISGLVDRLHGIERPDTPLRLIWHDWATAQDWREATFYWHWGGPPVGWQRALLEGLPVLAPQTAGPSTYVIGYGSPLEAAAALVSWPFRPEMLAPLRCHDVSRLRSFWRDAGPAPPAPACGARPVAALEESLRQQAAELAGLSCSSE